ncbi:MAG: TIGR00180 family glycosyltransferase [Nitrospinae bacterium]|nr:TIGR00180 family glycosyltransferase [Nitrospinota bacterium]MDA1046594.1 TIGR00180 family glycosyltransferase [Verrucomicrobiota bacterium]
MRNLKDLTIVIPTYNRPDFVKRSIIFWSGKLPSIIVLDGSLYSLDKEFLSSLGSNIKYFHYPKLVYQKRLKTIHQLVSTKYCMLHADDEFFLPSGLSECIKEIELHDLVCCLGRCLEFDYKDSRINAQPWLPLHTPFDGYSLLDERPLVRISKHMHPYLCSTIYAVTKTDVFLNNISFNLKNDSEGIFHELSYGICSAYQGKSKVINTLSWLRSNENDPFYVKDREKGVRPLEPYEIILKDDFVKSSVVNDLSEHLNSINKEYSVDLLGQIVFSSLRSYAYQANLTFQIAYLFQNNKIENSEEKIALKKLIGGKREIIFKDKDKSLINTSDLWRKIGVKSNTKEINEIENIILDSHNK